MLFSDDSYLYCKATTAEASKIEELLHKFERASGQKVNLGKSCIFFSSNTEKGLRASLCTQLHMNMADDRSLYLGLPSTLGGINRQYLVILRTKLESACKDGIRNFSLEQ